MRRRQVQLFLLTLFAGSTPACTELLEPFDPTFLAVTEIEVVNVTDSQPFSDLLEVEVHLYDANTGGFLGCSGEDSGLRDVDESGITYFVSGFFQRPPFGDEDVTFDDLRGRDLFVVVIEDDTDPCPEPTNEGSLDLAVDDLIGESPVFRIEDVSGSLVLGFGQVFHIVLEGLR